VKEGKIKENIDTHDEMWKEVRRGALMTLIMQITVSWNVTPCL
jgi:hypothetical protein